MTRDEVTQQIVAARLAHGLSWQELADALGKPVIWTAAALLGQHPLDAADAQTIVGLLDLDPSTAPILQAVPHRGTPAVPTDPTIYRFYEALMVYGPAIKEVIHEQFGDGIMSAINIGLSVDKRPHPDGDRVVVTFDGKFLPYAWTTE